MAQEVITMLEDINQMEENKMKKLLGKVDIRGYEKAFKYVNNKGEVWTAERPQPLSEEEKADRQEARDGARAERQAEGKTLRDAISKARKQARKDISVANAEALEEAVHAYAGFKAK